MANKYVIMIEIPVELTKSELGKQVVLQGVTGNPTGIVVGLQTLVETGTDPKTVSLTMVSEAGTLVL